MFGPRLTRIFASRWNALWWAACMLLLAWQLVPAPDDDQSQPDAQGQSAAGGDANPWAITTPAAGSR